LIPPDGYVAAKRALAHNQTGPHQPAAGLLSKARFVTGVASDVDAAAGDTLDAAGVNAIRIIANSVRIYGARSCSSDSANFRYYTAQDVLNTVVVQAYSQLDDLLFSVINGRNTVYGDVQSRLISLLEGLRLLGALYEAYDANGNKTKDAGEVSATGYDGRFTLTYTESGGKLIAKAGGTDTFSGQKLVADLIAPSGAKVITGLWNFGYDSSVVGNPANDKQYAPKSYTTNDKYNYANGIPTPSIPQKFAALADPDLVTKVVLADQITELLDSLEIDNGLYYSAGSPTCNNYSAPGGSTVICPL
jgi:hypothetical protein